MPEALCARCGKAVDPTVVLHEGNKGQVVCQACAGWPAVYGSDQEDHIDTTGLGVLRPLPHTDDPAQR